MNEVGWQAETVDALINLATRDPDILEIRVHGSGADPTRRSLDRWSDLDLVISVVDHAAARFLQEPTWLGPVGEVWAYEQTNDGEQATLRVVPSDLRRLDITVLAASGSGADRPGLPVYRRADGDGRGPADLLRTVDVHFPPPTGDQDRMRAIAGQFRFEAVQAVVKAARGDVLIGGHLALGLVRHVLAGAMLLRDRDVGTDHHRYGHTRWDAWAGQLETIPLPTTQGRISRCVRAAAGHFAVVEAEWGQYTSGSDAPLYRLLDAVDRAVR